MLHSPARVCRADKTTNPPARWGGWEKVSNLLPTHQAAATTDAAARAGSKHAIRIEAGNPTVNGLGSFSDGHSMHFSASSYKAVTSYFLQNRVGATL